MTKPNLLMLLVRSNDLNGLKCQNLFYLAGQKVVVVKKTGWYFYRDRYDWMGELALLRWRRASCCPCPLTLGRTGRVGHDIDQLYLSDHQSIISVWTIEKSRHQWLHSIAPVLMAQLVNLDDDVIKDLFSFDVSAFAAAGAKGIWWLVINHDLQSPAVFFKKLWI